MNRIVRLSINPFALMAGLYLTAALFFAILKGLSGLPGFPGPLNLNWVRVHLLTIGTVTQIIFAALPSRLSRKLDLPGISPGETLLQWALVNGSFILIMLGLVGVDAWTASLGALLLFAAACRLLTWVFGAWRQSARPWRESLRYYLTAPVFLLVGITMAVSLLFNWPAPGGRAGTLEAHVHANIWGFLALIVAGMLFDLFPALTGTPMARPGWIGRTYLLLTVGAAGLVAGPWVSLHSVTIGGLLLYFTGTGTLILNMLLTLIQARRATPAAMHLLLAYLWILVPAFFAPFILLAPGLLEVPAVEAAALQGLVNGWLLGVIMGALPWLLRSWREPEAPLAGAGDGRADGGWPSVVALNLGVALIWFTAVTTAPAADQVLTIAGYGLIALAWLPLLRRVWRPLTA